MRTTNAVASRNRRKKVLKAAKGMQHGRRRSYRLAKQATIRSLQYAYRDRRNRKRDFRRLWITRIGIAANENGTTYSKLMAGLKTANVRLNRKSLSEIAIHAPSAFSKIVELTTSSKTTK